MSTIKAFAGLVILLIAGTFLSCSSTKLVSAWKDSQYAGGYLNRVLVVGLSDTTEHREQFEAMLTERLKERGIYAVSLANVLPSEQKVEKDSIKGKALELGMDSIFVTHFVGIEEREVYYPPQRQSDLESLRFGDYYAFGRYEIAQPGYYDTANYFRLESNLYETATEKLIWTAFSEIRDPTSVDEIIESQCDIVMKNLRKNRLVP